MTWAALFGMEPAPPAPASPLQARALAVAASQLHVREQPPGSNRGPEVDAYLRAAGLDPASGSYPWCAAFVYWCFAQAAGALGLPNPAIRSAGVLTTWTKAGQANLRRIPAAAAAADTSLVRPGLVFVLATGAGEGHTGFVSAVDGVLLTTIEGNTNEGGSREGIGVFARHGRKLAAINRGFIDYT